MSYDEPTEEEFQQCTVAYFDGPRGWYWGSLPETAFVVSNLLAERFPGRRFTAEEVWRNYLPLTKHAETDEDGSRTLAWTLDITNESDVIETSGEPEDSSAEPEKFSFEDVWVPAGWIDRVLTAAGHGVARVEIVTHPRKHASGTVATYEWHGLHVALVGYDIHGAPVTNVSLDGMFE